jgi:hypothetical protein
MRKFSFGMPFMALAILALTLVLSLVFVSCSNGTANPDDDPDHDHTWGAWTVTTPATCTAQGTETRVCTRNESHTETRAITALGHSWGSWSVITQPTATQNGMEARTCARNPSHIETRSVPATGAPSTPGTTPGGTTPGTTPGGGNGTFTLTNIPSHYNGKWAEFEGATTTGTGIYPASWISVSNGSVSIPLPYSGNDNVRFNVYIWTGSTWGTYPRPDILASVGFNQVPFINGSATRSWTQADWVNQK